LFCWLGCFESKITCSREVLDSSPSLNDILVEANLQLQRKHFDKTIELLNQILLLDPANVSALIAKGNCHRDIKETEAALSCYSHALSIDPNDWTGRFERAVLYRDTDRLKEYQLELQLAIDLGPPDCPAKNEMATMLCNQGLQLKLDNSGDEAIALYELALSYSPVCATANFYLGVIYSERDYPQQALQYYKRAVLCDPQHYEALCNIGVTWKRAGRLKKAIKYYELSLQVHLNFETVNRNISIAFTDLGTRLKNTGRLEEAVELYKKALMHNAKYAAAWYNLGVAYSDKGSHSSDYSTRRLQIIIMYFISVYMLGLFYQAVFLNRYAGGFYNTL
jgi:protein O-GlcNAc transferase